MKNVNGPAELVELIKNTARSVAPEQVTIGELKSDGKIKVGASTIEKDDYFFLTTKIKIDDKDVIIPSLKDQEVEVTTQVKVGNETGEGKFKVKFPKLKSGDELLMIHLDDGDYAVFGKV